jgi:hypothetical protein
MKQLRTDLERLAATAVADFCFLVEWGMARTSAFGSLGLLLLGAITLDLLLAAILLSFLVSP